MGPHGITSLVTFNEKIWLWPTGGFSAWARMGPARASPGRRNPPEKIDLSFTCILKLKSEFQLHTMVFELSNIMLGGSEGSKWVCRES